tara:strand:+ start:75 stop:467 length:393 start_codon:yes stop_codon:yes gene_type:complete
MTITALLASQAVGTGANAGTDLFAGQLALQAATSGLVITGQLTNGAALTLDRKARIRVWFSTSPFDVASGIPAQFKDDAKMFELYLSGNPSGIKVTTSEFVINQGGYLYYWLECPTFSVAASLNLSAVEV